MTEKEALTRVKTGNFNGGRGFDMQLLFDAVGTIGEMLKRVMTPAEFLEALKEIDKTTKRPGRQYDDYEMFHISADELMCEILRGFGYGEGIDFFETHEKWYA